MSSGKTPEVDVAVTVRVRARTPEAGRDRVERWARKIEGYSSVVSVEVDDVELATEATTTSEGRSDGDE